MKDLDDLILEEIKTKKKTFNNDEKKFKLNSKESKEVNEKLDSFLQKKKINLIKKEIKEHFKLIIFSFSLIILTLSILTYYYFNFLSPVTKEINKKTNNNTHLINSNLNNSKNYYNKKDYNNLYDTYNNRNGEKVILSSYYKGEQIKINLSEKKEIIKKCNYNISCIVNYALKNKDPGICVYLNESKDKKECLNLYSKKINKLSSNKEIKKFEEIFKLLKEKKISIDDLDNYNITIETLVQTLGKGCEFIDCKNHFVSFCCHNQKSS